MEVRNEKNIINSYCHRAIQSPGINGAWVCIFGRGDLTMKRILFIVVALSLYNSILLLHILSMHPGG